MDCLVNTGKALGQCIVLIAPLLACTITIIGWSELTYAQPTEAETTEAETNRFESLVSSALAHYSRGEYLQAIQDFEEAYSIDDQPELMYNIARSYEKALLPEPSIQAYESFLKLPGTTAQLRTKALESLGALQKERNARNQNRVTPSPPPSIPKATSVAATTAVERVNRLPEYLFIGGGAIALVTGSIFGLMALDSNSELNDARDNQLPIDEQQALANDVDRQALVADILIGTGLASAATGVILFMVRKNEPRVALNPVLNRENLGFTLQARF